MGHYLPDVSAEWLVEAAFVAAASEHGRPQDVLCINIHGFIFKKPVAKGTILNIAFTGVKVGHTSIVVYVKAVSEIEKHSMLMDFLLLVCVEPDTKKRRFAHVQLDDTNDAEELEIRERAIIFKEIFYINAFLR